jgi:hypothetical protein
VPAAPPTPPLRALQAVLEDELARKRRVTPDLRGDGRAGDLSERRGKAERCEDDHCFYARPVERLTLARFAAAVAEAAEREGRPVSHVRRAVAQQREEAAHVDGEAAAVSALTAWEEARLARLGAAST